MRFGSIGVFWVLVLVSGVCLAEDGRPELGDEVDFRFGPGVLITDNAQAGVETEVYAIPAVYFEKGKFSIFGPMARWEFMDDEDWSFAAVGKLRSEGYDDDDGDLLRGMGERRATFEAGFALARDFDWGRLTAEWTADVVNEHKGYEARLVASRRFVRVGGLNAFSITPMLGVNWRSKQLNDHYYGVENNEATAFRPAYEVGDSFGWLTSVRLDYMLAEKWECFALVSAEWFDSEITDSPIVDQDYKLSAIIGAMYRF